MAEVTEQRITLQTADDLQLAATVFKPANLQTNRTLVIGSALGVPRYFYFKFARFFAANNYSVVTFDYRGIYESKNKMSSGADMNMAAWGEYDIEAALNYAVTELKSDHLYYLGHSCGGQLLGLAPTCTSIDRITFVACQSGYWKLWPLPLNFGVYLVWLSLFAMVPFFDYLPTKYLGISSLNLPSGVAKQWAAWGKTPGYLFNDIHHLDTSRYPKLTVPILSYRFDDDILLAPPKSVDALLEKYASAQIEKRTVTHRALNQKKIGHFGFFKEQLKDPLWQETITWFSK